VTLSEFIRNAHLHGLSDNELATLQRLVQAADRWQTYMQHVGDANNFNGALYRAVEEARRVFGDNDIHDPHFYCHWQCVAKRGVARCAKDQPVVHCTCGILNAVAWKVCSSCKQPLPDPGRKP
jgi:hypothetical protein